LKHATGDILAWCDADCRVSKKWFIKIEKAFAKNPALASLSGPYRYYDGNPLVQWAAAATWFFFAMPTYWIVGFMLLGGNFAARRNSLEAIGGFDTSIEFYGEDTNIARRLSKVGLVKFSMFFYNWSSTRRFSSLGLLKISFIYAQNFLGEAFLKKPATKTSNYVDVR
jgi:GT2 family glycosyltransferase